MNAQVSSAHGGMTSIPGRCERSVNGGEYICTREVGHPGRHVNRQRGMVYAGWDEADADDEDCICAHSATCEVDADEHLHRCDVCGTVLRQIEVGDGDPGPYLWLTDLHATPRDRKVRYEVVA